MLTRLLCLSALVLLLASPLYAQGTERDENVATKEATTEKTIGEEASERFRAQMAETQERLQLTDEQTEAVRPILEDAYLQQQAILENYGIDLENTNDADRPGRRTLLRMRSDMNDVHKETKKKLEDILTGEHMGLWEELSEERRAKMREKLMGSS